MSLISSNIVLLSLIYTQITSTSYIIYRTILKRVMGDYFKHKIVRLIFETAKTDGHVKTKRIHIFNDIIKSVAL